MCIFLHASVYLGYFLTPYFSPCSVYITFLVLVTGCDLGTCRLLCQFTAQFTIASGTFLLSHCELESLSPFHQRWQIVSIEMNHRASVAWTPLSILSCLILNKGQKR